MGIKQQNLDIFKCFSQPSSPAVLHVSDSQRLFDFVCVEIQFCRVMEFELCYKGTKLLHHREAGDVQLRDFWECLIQFKSINWNSKG